MYTQRNHVRSQGNQFRSLNRANKFAFTLDLTGFEKDLKPPTTQVEHPNLLGQKDFDFSHKSLKEFLREISPKPENHDDKDMIEQLKNENFQLQQKIALLKRNYDSVSHYTAGDKDKYSQVRMKNEELEQENEDLRKANNDLKRFNQELLMKLPSLEMLTKEQEIVIRNQKKEIERLQNEIKKIIHQHEQRIAQIKRKLDTFLS